MKLILITKGEDRETWRDLPRFCDAHGLDYRLLRNAQQRQGKQRFPVEFEGYIIEQTEASNDCFTNVKGELVEFEPDL